MPPPSLIQTASHLRPRCCCFVVKRLYLWIWRGLDPSLPGVVLLQPKSLREAQQRVNVLRRKLQRWGQR